MPLSLWLMIGLAALATFGIRVLFGVLPKAWQLPPSTQGMLENMPVAVFAALAAPGLPASTGGAVPTLSASHVLAVVVAGYVAWHTKHLALALIAGIVVFGLDVWVS